jgi:hypothetical protein
MEKIARYESAILDALKTYQSRFRLSSQDLKSELIVDDDNHHYQFLWTGWKNDHHIFKVAFHIDIVDDKVWIQQDNTEEGIANLLVERGILKSEIVLGYFPLAHRQLTEFAVN